MDHIDTRRGSAFFNFFLKNLSKICLHIAFYGYFPQLVEVLTDKMIGSLLDQLFRTGVREFVVCPGARNAPLVLALIRSEGIVVWNHFEERSAGFFALGRMRATGWPCAVVTTSGTAVAELLAAVVEAHYQARPLLVISADRPHSFRGTGAPQSIEQVGIFGAYLEGEDDVQSGKEMILEKWSAQRPWHLNVCLEEDFEQELIKGRAADELNERPREKLSQEVVKIPTFLEEDFWKGIVVVVGALEPEEREEVYHFLKKLKLPAVLDPQSGLREALSELSLVDPDRVLRDQIPGKVLRIGEVPHGRFWRDLENLEQVEVLSMTRAGFAGLGRSSVVVKGEIERLVRALGDSLHGEDALDLMVQVPGRAAKIDELLETFPDSEPGFIRALSLFIANEPHLYLGNSLPIREWALFAQRDLPVMECWANRGANGIDGQLSSWLGWCAEEEESWAIVGDLTALYDLNSLSWLQQIPEARRRLVVINNQGGQIFNRLPRLAGLDEKEKEVILNRQEWNLASWAELWGVHYHLAQSIDDLDEIEGQEGFVLIEVRPRMDDTQKFWEAWETR